MMLVAEIIYNFLTDYYLKIFDLNYLHHYITKSFFSDFYDSDLVWLGFGAQALVPHGHVTDVE